MNRKVSYVTEKFLTDEELSWNLCGFWAILHRGVLVSAHLIAMYDVPHWPFLLKHPVNIKSELELPLKWVLLPVNLDGS